MYGLTLLLIASRLWRASCRQEGRRQVNINHSGNCANTRAQAHYRTKGSSSAQRVLLELSPREAECRVRTGNAPQDLAKVRRMALTLLGQDQTFKASNKAKRTLASWDNQYLLAILSNWNAVTLAECYRCLFHPCSAGYYIEYKWDTAFRTGYNPSFRKEVHRKLTGYLDSLCPKSSIAVTRVEDAR